MNASPKKRVAVLVSGRGSNMTALIEAAQHADYPAEIVMVISNRPDAAAIGKAQASGIAAMTIDHKQFANRDAHERAIEAALLNCNAEIICLAGYMRILGAGFVSRWRGRMINIHPALLPAFPGTDTHARALAAGVRIHGASVHFVTEGVDDGPSIAQAAVPVLAGDDEQSLAARVLAAELQLYPHALALLARGAVHLDNGNAVFASGHETDAGSTLFSPSLR